jgi:V/A-type H+-transporting ATPase subunit I
MAIVPIIHATVIGMAKSKINAMTKFQEKGFLHIISSVEGFVQRSEHHTSQTIEAYHYLKNCPGKRRQSQEDGHFDQKKVIQEALAIKERTIVLEEERDYILQRIKNLQHWGDFTFPPISQTGGYRFWFYIVPLYHLGDFAEIEYPWECVYKDNREGYIVVISKEEPEGMPVPRTHTGSRPLSAIRERLDVVEAELEDLRWRRKGLTRWLTIFARQLASAEDKALLDKMVNSLYDDGELFYFQAWIPEQKVEELHECTRKAGLLLQIRPPREEETPPTLLENPPAWTGGESLVEYYTIPAYDMWDPSKSLFLSFAFFFAMIVSDAGYGLLFSVGWFITRKKLSRSSEGFCNLFGVIAIVTILYGMMIGSYFGIEPTQESLLAQVKLLDIRNKDQMMFFSISIGVAHLIIANCGNFIFGARPRFYLQPLGWIMTIAGGFSWWLGDIVLAGMDLLVRCGQSLMVGGVVFILFFSSKRSMNSWKDMLLRIVDGLIALTGFSKAFGDVLSYLRLFALGLASAQLALTFNSLATQAISNISGLGTLVAVCILTVGHGLNLLLAMMSGIVHGLRLNYIEFFNWGLEEEGYAFKPFQKRRISIWNQL